MEKRLGKKGHIFSRALYIHLNIVNMEMPRFNRNSRQRIKCDCGVLRQAMQLNCCSVFSFNSPFAWLLLKKTRNVIGFRVFFPSLFGSILSQSWGEEKDQKFSSSWEKNFSSHRHFQVWKNTKRKKTFSPASSEKWRTKDSLNCQGQVQVLRKQDGSFWVLKVQNRFTVD